MDRQKTSGPDETREQIRDVYAEGTTEGIIRQSPAKEIRIPRIGYDEMFEQEQKEG